MDIKIVMSPSKAIDVSRRIQISVFVWHALQTEEGVT